MKNGKTLISFVLIAAFVAVLLTGCKTSAPVSASTAFPENCTILGRITIKTDSQKSGYMKLLDAAKKQYPGCDDVVNILVDAETNNYFIFVKNTYTMSGIAIKYK